MIWANSRWRRTHGWSGKQQPLGSSVPYKKNTWRRLFYQALGSRGRSPAKNKNTAKTLIYTHNVPRWESCSIIFRPKAIADKRYTYPVKKSIFQSERKKPWPIATGEDRLWRGWKTLTLWQSRPVSNRDAVWRRLTYVKLNYCDVEPVAGHWRFRFGVAI